MGVAVGAQHPTPETYPRGGRGSRTWRRCDEGDPSTRGRGRRGRATLKPESGEAEGGARGVTGDPTGSAEGR